MNRQPKGPAAHYLLSLKRPTHIPADCIAALKATTSTTGDRPAACATLNDDEYTDAVIAYTEELAGG